MNLATIRAELKKVKAVPKFVAPGPAFDASKLKGKVVYNIPSNSTNPFYGPITQGMEQAAKAVGIKLVTYSNQGTSQQWAAGIDQAIAQHANAIVLGSVQPDQVKPQIDAARAHGIVVTESHQYWPGAKVPNYIDGTNDGPFTQAAQLMAKYAIVNSNAKVNAVLVTDNEYPSSKAEQQAMLATFKSICPNSCKATSVDVPITNWASIQSEVASALTKDPTINWVIPVYDTMSQYIVPAVRAKGMTGKVSVAAYNGTPSVLKQITDTQIVKMDLGENPAAIGWQSMDQAMRLMLKLPAAPKEVTPLRMFDSSNIAEAGNPPKYGVGYGNQLVFSKFETLWGLKK